MNVVSQRLSTAASIALLALAATAGAEESLAGRAQSSGNFSIGRAEKILQASPNTLNDVRIGDEIRAGGKPVSMTMTAGNEVRLQRGSAARLNAGGSLEAVNGEILAVVGPTSKLQVSAGTLTVTPSKDNQVVVVQRLNEDRVRFASLNGKIAVRSIDGAELAKVEPKAAVELNRTTDGWVVAQAAPAVQEAPPVQTDADSSQQIVWGYDFPWPKDNPNFWGDGASNAISMPMVHLEPFAPVPAMNDPYGRAIPTNPWSNLATDADADLGKYANAGNVRVGINPHDVAGAPPTANPIETGTNFYWPSENAEKNPPYHYYYFGGLEPRDIGKQYYQQFSIPTTAAKGPIATYRNIGFSDGSSNPTRVIEDSAQRIGFYVFHTSVSGDSIPAGTFTLRLRYDPAHSASPDTKFDRDFNFPEIPANKWTFVTIAPPKPNSDQAYTDKNGVVQGGILYDRAVLLLNKTVGPNLACADGSVSMFITGGRQLETDAAALIATTTTRRGFSGFLVPAAVIGGIGIATIGGIAGIVTVVGGNDSNDNDDDREPSSPVEPTATPIT